MGQTLVKGERYLVSYFSEEHGWLTLTGSDDITVAAMETVRHTMSRGPRSATGSSPVLHGSSSDMESV